MFIQGRGGVEVCASRVAEEAARAIAAARDNARVNILDCWRKVKVAPKTYAGKYTPATNSKGCEPALAGAAGWERASRRLTLHYPYVR